MTDSIDQPRVLGGRYEVGELIGRGGMAEVHLGHDTRLGRTVAIKMLRADLARDSTFLIRFRREAQSAAGLNHHAIVSVFDSGEDVFIETGGAQVDIPYIVMEYVDGKTLREVLNEDGALAPDEAARITQGILSALEYSHDKGIVHRDIKPANVMISRGGSVKVMDFGIARALADAGATMTSAQTVVGTARYLSPEQARGATVDGRSDLYSTGCVLFELLTARTPFVGEPVSLVYQHIQDAPSPPSSYETNVPPTFDAVTVHALGKQPDERYQTAADFRADLQSARTGRGVSEAAIASLAALGVGATAPRARAETTPPQTRADHTADLAQVQEPPRRTALWAMAIGVALAAIFGIGWLVYQNAQEGDEPTTMTTSVPSVVGLPRAQAVATLTGEGFRTKTVQVASATVERGTVVSQSPEPQTVASNNSQVTINVSSGPGSTTMPDLRGLTEAAAKSELTKRGIKQAQIQVAEQPADDTTYAKDQVASTSPQQGSAVELTQRITLRLSSGKVTVPTDLAGKSQADAAQALSEVGLRVKQPVTYRVVRDPDLVDRVISVPSSGDKVDLDSEVELIIGKAPDATVTVSPTPSTTTPPPATSTPPSTSSTPPPPSSTPPSSTPAPSTPPPAT